jgi:hypothetical protein
MDKKQDSSEDQPDWTILSKSTIESEDNLQSGEESQQQGSDIVEIKK